MKYKLLNGDMVDTSELPEDDLQFLLHLQNRAMDGEDYFELLRTICGPSAYPLKGGLKVTREVHDSILYRVAENIVDRVGIHQGVILPNQDDEMVPTDEIVGAAEAADILGVSRSAVIKAAQRGRIRGKKVGHAWALLLESVQSYHVAPYRVAAGRAAHSSPSRTRA